MKATLVVSTLMGLTAAGVMPRGGGDYSDGDGVTTKVSAHPVSVPLSTGTAYPQGNGGDDDDDDDDDDYCDDEGDDSGDDNGDHGGHYTWPTIPVPQTTSTVTATSVYTVTSCPPTVTNCPVGHVTTEVVTDYTTYCPAPTGEITKYSTMMVTITECPKTVTNCPARTTASVSSCVYTPVPTEQTVYKTVTVPTCPAAQSGHGCWETHSEVQTSWYYAPPTTPAHATETAYPSKTGQTGWGNGANPTSTPGQTGWGNGAYPTTKPAGQGQGWGTGYTVPPTTVATTYAYGTGKAPVPTSTYAVTAGVGKVGFSAAAIIAGVAAFML